MTPSRLLIGLLQPLLALLLLAGVPLPGAGHAPDAGVAAVETAAKGLHAQRDRFGGTELRAPDDLAGNDDLPAGGTPVAIAVALERPAPAGAAIIPVPASAPGRSRLIPAAPPTGPPFA
ncbi:hypothetical protein [Salinarimonas soli]|uniref:Uncharacterized protein n=1 Tax=Salinarimonas soli TaxID=1638099 RepID=A0A5B2W0P9_9HYPH|nr:hypothetical protein [Salinarimonas soli]KAA2244300.1 hypothetical protein F0L46_00485 [Salinarimonas soli]